MVNIDINLRGFSKLQIAALSLFSLLSDTLSSLVPQRINTKCLVNKPTCPLSAPTVALKSDVMTFGMIDTFLWSLVTVVGTEVPLLFLKWPFRTSDWNQEALCHLCPTTVFSLYCLSHT